MNFARKTVINLAPHLVWTLFFSILFTVVTNFLNNIAFDVETISFDLLYLKGLFLFFPLLMLSYFRDTTDELWKFIVKSIILVIFCGIVTQSFVFILSTAVFAYLRVSNNLSKEKSSFDTTPTVVLLFMLALFVVSGFAQAYIFQKIIVFHFLFISLLIFSRGGLMRFESYVELKKDRSNLPAKRILDNATKIFIGISLAIALLLCPIIRYQYSFVAIGVDTSDEAYDYEVDETENDAETDVTTSEDSINYGDLENEGALADFLQPLWNFLEPVSYISAYVVFAYFMIKALIAFILNLKNPLVVKNDVIESTLAIVQEDRNSTVSSSRFSDFFDFSKDMSVRKRYKRTLKKHSPKEWQTPTEMEQMASLEIPDLHSKYLEVRYGKNSDE